MYDSSLKDRSLLEDGRGLHLQVDMNNQISAYDTHLVNEIAKVMCKNLIKIRHYDEQSTQTQDNLERVFSDEIQRLKGSITDLEYIILDLKNQIDILNHKIKTVTQSMI